MKIIKLLVLICIPSFTYSQTNGEGLSNTVADKLLDDMHSFFVETLKNNYNEESEENLFRLFMNDCSDFYWQEYSKNYEKNVFRLDFKVDKSKLNKINKRLFKKDASHYYYFYPEVILLSKDDNYKDHEMQFNQKHPNVPVSIFQTLSTSTTYKRKILNFYESVNVDLVRSKGFLNDVKYVDSNTVKGLLWHLEAFGSVFMYNFSELFVRGDAKNEFRNRITQDIITVVFWKLLCMHAGVEFHTPLEY